jgi:hypothetical protein
MKERYVMSLKTILFGCGLMVLSGCHTLQDTQFAPLAARLERDHPGNAQRIVLVNVSGQELHHFFFRGSLWGDSALTYTGDPSETLPQHISPETYTFIGSGDKLEPGQALHFKQRDMGIEGRIIGRVTRIQVAGRCDEGSFREDWQINPDGQLRKTGTE